MTTLTEALRDLEQPNLARVAEVLVHERNAALHDAWVVRRQNEQLRDRLHQVIGERNNLRDHK